MWQAWKTLHYIHVQRHSNKAKSLWISTQLSFLLNTNTSFWHNLLQVDIYIYVYSNSKWNSFTILKCLFNKLFHALEACWKEMCNVYRVFVLEIKSLMPWHLKNQKRWCRLLLRCWQVMLIEKERQLWDENVNTNEVVIIVKGKHVIIVTGKHVYIKEYTTIKIYIKTFTITENV